MTLYPIYILVCIVIVLHVLASIYIATRQNLEQFQIVGKIVSIWFIPFLVSISIDLLYKIKESLPVPRVTPTITEVIPSHITEVE